MPELGKYAVAVIGSYGVALVLLGGLIVASIVQGRRAAKRLKALENKRKTER